MDAIKALCIKLFQLLNKCIESEDDPLRQPMIELEDTTRKGQKPAKNQLALESTQSGLKRDDELRRQQEIGETISSVVKFVTKGKNNRLSNKSLQVLFNFDTKPNNGVVHLKNSKPFYKKEQLDMLEPVRDNRKRSWSTDNMELSGLDAHIDVSQKMRQWNQKHYIYFKHHEDYSYLNQNLKLKLTRSILLGLINKKLEDFYNFLSRERKTTNKIQSLSLEHKDDSMKKKKGQYNNDKIGLKCLYRRKNKKKTAKGHDFFYQKLITFQCNASNPSQLLKWFNHQKNWQALYNFRNMRLVQNQKYSVFQAQQFSDNMESKHYYTIVRQIEVAKYDHLPGKQFILQADFSFGKDCSFQNLLKFEIGKESKIEIFTQSSQRAYDENYKLYEEQWKTFEQSLLKSKIAKKSIIEEITQVIEDTPANQ